MASPRRPLNPPATPEPKAKFATCSMVGCSNNSRHWLKVAERKFAPVCHPCFVALPNELKTK